MRSVSIRAFVCAVHLVVWFVVLSTITAELFPSFKALLADGFGHHWIAKSDISVLLFIASCLVFARKKDPEDIRPLVRGVLLSTVAGAAAIFGFYLLHYMGMV